MVIDYNSRYDEDIKELLYELQEYVMKIDREGYNVISEEYKDDYFRKAMKEINEYNGKIMLYKKKDKIVGLIVGCVNNEKIDEYDFKAPKRGKITELIVSKKYRGQKIGEELFSSMENHLKGIGCEAILIEVFAYNEFAKSFYEKKGYHFRAMHMIKVYK